MPRTLTAAISLNPLTLYAYRAWSIRPIGTATIDAARDACWSAMEADDTLDAVRAIDDATGECRVSIDRDEDGALSDLSDLTARDAIAKAEAAGITEES